MRRIFKATTWEQLGCTLAQANKRMFAPWEAVKIRDYQRQIKKGIDRFDGSQIKSLAGIIKRDPNKLRDELSLERRKSVQTIGEPPYLNKNGKSRGRNQRPSAQRDFGVALNVSTQWIEVAILNVDPKYQRALKSKYKDYGEGWDTRAAGALVVSHRGDDGRLYVVDGFQRLEGAKIAGITHVLCVVVRCIDTADEANLFVKCNIDRTNLNSLEKFWAGVISGAEKYVEVNRVIEKHGLRVGRPGHPDDGTSTGTIRAVKKLEDLYVKSPGALDRTLKVVADSITVSNRSEILSGFYLGGIGEFVRSGNGKIDLARLSEKLRTMDFHACSAKAKSLSGQAKSLGLGGGGSIYFAQAIGLVYDSRLAATKKVGYRIDS